MNKIKYSKEELTNVSIGINNKFCGAWFTPVNELIEITVDQEVFITMPVEVAATLADCLDYLFNELYKSKLIRSKYKDVK